MAKHDTRQASSMERIPTGIQGFDALIDGGLPANRLYVLCGPPGSGKTTFCAQFITEGVRRGETVLYVTMHETLDELLVDMQGYNFGFDRAVQSEGIEFLNLATTEGVDRMQQFGIEAGFRGRLRGAIEDVDADRVVVDSKMLLTHFLDNPEGQLSDFLIDLKGANATVVMISEMTDPTAYSAEHYLAHGVIFMHNFIEGGTMRRGAQVLKMRGTAIDTDIHHVEFSSSGLNVDPERKLAT